MWFPPLKQSVDRNVLTVTLYLQIVILKLAYLKLCACSSNTVYATLMGRFAIGGFIPTHFLNHRPLLDNLRYTLCVHLF